MQPSEPILTPSSRPLLRDDTIGPYNPKVAAHWCSWLTRCPLKAEITGSSPVCAANFSRSEEKITRMRNTLLLSGLLGFVVLSFVVGHAVIPLMANAQSPDTKVSYAPITSGDYRIDPA